MTYEPTETQKRVSALMERVDEFDHDLANELSDTCGDEIREAEDRAVILHGRHVLATIEGRGFGSDAGHSDYFEDSRWLRIETEMAKTVSIMRQLAETVDQHNWEWPLRVYTLGLSVDFAFTQASKGRRRQAAAS
jgi:hypothetical protein